MKKPEEVTVGEVQSYRGVLTALDTKTGTFKLEDDATGMEYRGKITDPALGVPQNVYSHALDLKTPISVTAKPTLKEDGTVHKLLVSDAKND